MASARMLSIRVTRVLYAIGHSKQSCRPHGAGVTITEVCIGGCGLHVISYVPGW